MNTNEEYDYLFEKLGFKTLRNEIFNDFHSKLQEFKENNSKDINNLVEIFNSYIEKEKNLEIKEFSFIPGKCGILFYHKSHQSIKFVFEKLKHVTIFTKEKSNECVEEWILGEKYLKYIINNIYKMKNPKFAHKLDSINDENSIISLNDLNIKNFMDDNWDYIYEASTSIDFQNIFKNKEIYFTEKQVEKDPFYLKLIEIDSSEKINFNKFQKHSSSLMELFNYYETYEQNIIIFHNEDKYFKLNLLNELEYHKTSGHFGYLYLNYKNFANLRRQERLEMYAYCLLSLFPNNYTHFQQFFEDNIKYLISDDLKCFPDIIDKIIEYFSNNVFGDKAKESNLYVAENKEDIHFLFNKVNEKKFFIIFDDIEENKIKTVIDDITNKYSKNFLYITIYSLKNMFGFEEFFKTFLDKNTKNSQNILYFANLFNLNPKSQQEDEDITLNIFKKNCIEEELIYDLIRIFHFKEIFVNSKEYEENLKSIKFLKKYFIYLNIKFNNQDKKIEDIAFKSKKIEDEFNTKYLDSLNIIKTRKDFKLSKFVGQKDAFDIEKIIISSVFYDNKYNFETLKLWSIFGLKDVKKLDNVKYESSNFILEQESSGGEAFDFGIKITSQNKQILKLYNSTSDKTKEEKNKLRKEKINAYSSYLKKRFKDEQLGELDAISFGIISSKIILNDKKKYQKMKEFCKKNNYEFILFDLDDRSFYVENNNGKLISYGEDIYKIKKENCLNIIDFDKIFTIKKNLEMLSTRHVKSGKEKEEDEIANIYAKEKIGKNVVRVSKFEYKGDIFDLTELNEDYLCFFSDNKKKKAFFYKDSFFQIDDNFDRKKKLFNLILYSINLSPEDDDVTNDKNDLFVKNENIELDEEKEKEKEEEKEEEKGDLKTSASIKKGNRKDKGNILGKKTKNK